MKQHIVCMDGSDITGFHWDVETPLRAHIMTSCKLYIYIYIYIYRKK